MSVRKSGDFLTGILEKICLIPLDSSFLGVFSYSINNYVNLRWSAHVGWQI